ncbi:MAG: hypothetical protein ABJE95_39950 [Byssovorax sp.]
MTSRKRFSLRSLLFPVLAGAALVAPAVTSGCGGGFDPISKVDGLRVLSVAVSRAPTTADPTTGGSYAHPDDEVTFEMTSYDGFVDPANPDAPTRALQTVWLGGCYDPDGDAYYGCYASLGPIVGKLSAALADFNAGKPLVLPEEIGLGNSFTTKLPTDIISRRPTPVIGSHYGIAYVFFATCAGFLGAAPQDSGGNAGSFPIACFADAKHTIRLGADSFVPGYTQIYVFEDGRVNADPSVKALMMNGKDPGDGPGNAISVPRCSVDDDTRTAPASCSKPDPFTTCTPVNIDIVADATVADVDPEGMSVDGKPLKEVVWVDYFSDTGDFDSDVRLVNDATTGLIADHSTNWIAPTEPGLASIWAVVHDARGGVTTLQRYIKVE